MRSFVGGMVGALILGSGFAFYSAVDARGHSTIPISIDVATGFPALFLQPQSTPTLGLAAGRAYFDVTENTLGIVDSASTIYYAPRCSLPQAYSGVTFAATVPSGVSSCAVFLQTALITGNSALHCTVVGTTATAALLDNTSGTLSLCIW